MILFCHPVAWRGLDCL